MMRKIDNRGAAAFEFILAFVPLFTLIFVIFDLGRYAITLQSLQTLADVAARAVMIGCYTNDAVRNNLSSAGTDCATAGNPLSTTQMKNAAPLLSGLTPTVTVTSSGTNLVVTAQVVFPEGLGMTPLTQKLWPVSFNKPSVSRYITF
jgi:Flp pilus assembly protein TadG